MKVNHNMSAVVTNAQLLKTEGSLSASMERLSSGLKINHAKDDPAGIAISNKMQAQIDGLEQASQNASNGISVLQIADSALGEITSILQRMRELSVQAATDTNQLSDREAIQLEIESLREEVDRISRDTEYNTKKLIDGTLDTHVYGSGFTRMAITDSVMAGDYEINVDMAATQASARANVSTGTIPAGKVVINGYEVVIEEGEDQASVFEKLREGAAHGDVNLITVAAGSVPAAGSNPTTGGYTPDDTPFSFGSTVAFVSNQYGSGSAVEISCSNDDLAAFLGLDNTMLETPGLDAEVELTSGFGVQGTINMDGNKARITDIDGFRMTFMLDPGVEGKVNMKVTDVGTMVLQIGANEHQTMEVRIPEVSADTLYLDEVDVTMVNGGGHAIAVLDEAISTASSVRSSIGAYQNRLEYAVDSLNASDEDMTNALSRISDTDMAKEMSEYTKYTVLQQAATSVLAQANDLPQTVLQLLQ